jgi:hypothetical protein
MLFQPSREEVRQFFTDAWRKRQSGAVTTPLEAMAADTIQMHPEYHAALMDPDIAHADFPVEEGRTNPFLHLSMHLAINEQLSIDQPPGIKDVHQSLLRTHDAHEAAHIIMEALGEAVWEVQRLGKVFDSERYLELIRRVATRDNR